MFFDIVTNIGKWSLANINNTSNIILNNINGSTTYNDFIDN